MKHRGIKYIDIRGPTHLDVLDEIGQNIMSKFKISKILITCGNDYSNKTAAIYGKGNIISAVGWIKGETQVLFPPIFGHMRGKKSKDPMENLFFSCLKKHFDSFSSRNERYALASEAAKYFVKVMQRNESGVFDYRNITTYKDSDLHDRFYNYCINSTDDTMIKDLVSDCRPYSPGENKKFTLSIITISSCGVHVERLNRTLSIFDHYLAFYPKLPMELIIVFPTTVDGPMQHLNEIINIGSNVKPYIKVIEMDYIKYMDIFRENDCKTFPEFIFRNIAIRRSKGEYILSLSCDTFPSINLFDSVLHHKFLQNTLYRANKVSVSIDHDNNDLYQMIENETGKYRQWFSDSFDYNYFLGTLVLVGIGDFTLTHWKSWRSINGYLNGREVYHVDSLFGVEMMVHQLDVLLVRMIGTSWHWWHTKISKNAPLFEYFTKLNYASSGILSAYSYYKRPEWGLPNDTSLGEIVF